MAREDVLAADNGITNEEVIGLKEDVIEPTEKVDERFLVEEPKCLPISTRGKLFNAFSFNTGTLTKSHGGKLTFIRDTSKDWNYNEICNIIEKS